KISGVKLEVPYSGPQSSVQASAMAVPRIQALISAILHFLKKAFVILDKILAVEIEEDKVADLLVGMPVHVVDHIEKIVCGRGFDLDGVVVLEIVAILKARVVGGIAVGGEFAEVGVLLELMGVELIQQLNDPAIANLQAP